ncbi:TPA: response regulator transcription factor [Bacillus thuringiensis]|uniref:response regulator transcription factor n=1 Tax=Bacillus sp. CH_70 TaxID=2978215 RepID=UPI0030F7008D|nr:response regulator transcription factor [Bacillus thuringiensis]
MKKEKLLLVEDDRDLNHLVKEFLEREGFNITSVFDGEEAIKELSTKKYDLLILDIMLPIIDGLTVLKKLRNNSYIPVIILSAKDADTDKIIGLGLGADDYVTKPFNVDILLARVKAQLRRNSYMEEYKLDNKKIFKHGKLHLNLENYKIYVNGTEKSLTNKEFELLKLLMLNPNKVYTKSQIYQEVWGEEYLQDESTVQVHIRKLRKKIEKDPANPVYIRTIWGIGYKLGEMS